MPEETIEPVMAISPLDPDWILMLLFAMLVDVVDLIVAILAIALPPSMLITILSSWVLDLVVFAIIGGWMFWRTGQMAKSKKQRQEAMVKKLESQIERLKKLGQRSETIEKALQATKKALTKFLRPVAKTLSKVLAKAGLSFLAEAGFFIPALNIIMGAIPFWTISVFLMLREKGE